jgi:hypothetical protein
LVNETFSSDKGTPI